MTSAAVQGPMPGIACRRRRPSSNGTSARARATPPARRRLGSPPRGGAPPPTGGTGSTAPRPPSRIRRQHESGFSRRRLAQRDVIRRHARRASIPTTFCLAIAATSVRTTSSARVRRTDRCSFHIRAITSSCGTNSVTSSSAPINPGRGRAPTRRPRPRPSPARRHPSVRGAASPGRPGSGSTPGGSVLDPHRGSRPTLAGAGTGSRRGRRAPRWGSSGSRERSRGSRGARRGRREHRRARRQPHVRGQVAGDLEAPRLRELRHDVPRDQVHVSLLVGLEVEHLGGEGRRPRR